MEGQFISPATTYVVLRGSSTVTAPMRQIARQYMAERPSIGLPIIGGGTARGYKSVLDGTADIGMASGAMPDDIGKWARKRALNLTAATIAFDGIAAIVNPDNPIRSLDFAQLADIYTGAVRDWRELGSFKGPISVFSQDPLQGTHEVWEQAIAGASGVITPNAIVVDGATIGERVANDIFAIGYQSALLVGLGLVSLRIDGSLPTADEVRAGRYPIRRELSLLTRPKPRPEIADFIGFCLDPQQGQKILKQAGAVPAHAG